MRQGQGAKEERENVATLRRTSDDEGNAEIAHNSAARNWTAKAARRARPLAESKAAFPYRRPRTSCISYNPGFCFTTHLAALTAPWENMSLVWARWVISMRSPMPMK